MGSGQTSVPKSRPIVSTGPIKPGGITDKLLADYPNLYGDMSANSCRNTLARDPEFSRDLSATQRTKLMFGTIAVAATAGFRQTSQAPLIKGNACAETLTR